MNIIELKERQNISDDIKLNRIYVQFGELLKELAKKDLPLKIIDSINQDIEEINSTSLTNNELIKLVKLKQTKIIKIVEKELKIVPKNYYRNLWLALGLSVFGLPIGVALGLSIGNMGLLGMGLPIGMVIGIVVGTGMDKKASEEGRQLDVEIKY
jgi:predicted RND superfamily exporter protein